MNQDLENEIQEAMTETVQTEDNLDGKLVIYFHLKKKIIYHLRIIFFLVSVLFFIYFSLILIIWFFVCDASQFLNNCLEIIFQYFILNIFFPLFMSALCNCFVLISEILSVKFQILPIIRFFYYFAIIRSTFIPNLLN